MMRVSKPSPKTSCHKPLRSSKPNNMSLPSQDANHVPSFCDAIPFSHDIFPELPKDGFWDHLDNDGHFTLGLAQVEYPIDHQFLQGYNIYPELATEILPRPPLDYGDHALPSTNGQAAPNICPSRSNVLSEKFSSQDLEYPRSTSDGACWIDATEPFRCSPVQFLAHFSAPFPLTPPSQTLLRLFDRVSPQIESLVLGELQRIWQSRHAAQQHHARVDSEKWDLTGNIAANLDNQQAPSDAKKHHSADGTRGSDESQGEQANDGRTECQDGSSTTWKAKL